MYSAIYCLSYGCALCQCHACMVEQFPIHSLCVVDSAVIKYDNIISVTQNVIFNSWSIRVVAVPLFPFHSLGYNPLGNDGALIVSKALSKMSNLQHLQ